MLNCLGRKICCSQKGFTIVELYMSLTILVILGLAIGSVYMVGEKMYFGGINRVDIRSDGANAMELIKYHLMHAKSIDEITENSLTFTADVGNGDETFRAYLYHDSDAEPNPPYTEQLYDLKLLQGGTTYGEGKVLARNVEVPGTEIFRRDNNVITLDWTLLKEDASLRLRSKVRPRNL